MENKNKPSILLVDDLSENLTLLEHIIKPLGVTMILANSGYEALRKTENKELFMALVDVKMPGMDGIELAGHLQSNHDRGMIPIIFVTAFADNEVLEKCYEVGAVDFITKPFQRHILLSKVKVFLELFNQKNEIRENQLKLEESTLELDRINQSLKQSHEELTELTSHLEDVREDERKRIALDLHDDLGQKLTALLMDLSWLNKNLTKDLPSLTAKIGSMKNLLDDTINTVRKISVGLRPSTLDNLGLAAALRWHFSEFENNTGIRVVSNIIPEELELDPKLSILIYRVVQEALTNVVRHAKASMVSIRLEQNNGTIHIEISDNGIGITKKEIEKPRSFGLLGMKERVASWGGKFVISGEAGKGTKLVIDLPVNNHKK
ncbi:MAG: response regulator [Bacteroidales bacterium]|nr:response regulator [Bacteroidales bacterium]